MRSKPLLLTAAIAVSCPAANAHDLRGLGDHSVKLSRELNHTRLSQLAQQQQLDPEARYVYARLLLWTPGSTLKGCFFGGSDAERKLVLDTAKELLDGKQVNLAIDFGPAATPRSCNEPGRRADVRVSFSHGCCAAYVGQNAHYPHPAILDGPSVKLEGVLSYGAAYAKKIVMHELLHVLGLEHEHQSPAVLCEMEFKKDVILSRFGWTDNDYQANLAQLNSDSRAYKWSSYDPSSIMKYHFDSSLLKSPETSECRLREENWVPSAQDYEGLRDAYPMAGAPVTAERARGLVGALANAVQLPTPVRDLARARAQREPQ